MFILIRISLKIIVDGVLKKHIFTSKLLLTNIIWSSKNVFRFYVIFMELPYFLQKIFFFLVKSQERFCLRLTLFLLVSIILLHKGLLDR